MNIEHIKSVVSEKQEQELSDHKLQELRNSAVELYICPDCGDELKSITNGFLIAFLGTGKLKCTRCGNIHKVYYDWAY